MLTAESQDAFERYLAEHGSDLQHLDVRTAVGIVTDWYQSQRIDGLDPTTGDMLLFQWGAMDLGQGPSFHFDLVRQFILDDEFGDDAIWQLHLTLHYPADDSLGRGNHWCDSPADVDDFRRTILGEPIVASLNAVVADRAEVFLEPAG